MTMKPLIRCWRIAATSGLFTIVAATMALVTVAARNSEASIFKLWGRCQARTGHGCGGPESVAPDIDLGGELGGTWYWLRSPEEEKRIIIGLYNRYCIRCHGVDGRGIWDIPGVPDFTNVRWQASRSDGQLARAILEGRGACMPPFRGTLTLEEACAMARYLRTLVPGTEVSRPDLGQPDKPATPAPTPMPKVMEKPMK
jgi:hypothetical protein